MNARRIATWFVGALLVAAAMAIVWSLAYAAVTSVIFKNGALFSALTKSDPLIAFKHVLYYWTAAAVKRNAAIATVGTLALFGAAFVSLFIIKPPSTFGDARFARGGDLFRANLHAKKGLILGWHGSALLRNDDPRHPLVTGPTRSGKGRGFVIPNLLAWGGSTVTLDIKQENFVGTAGARRAAGDEVYMFAPGSARSHRYNPLDFVRWGPEKITDLTNVAHFLIPDPRSGEIIWSQKARDLFVGVLGYVLESKLLPDDARTIRTAIRVLSTGRDIGALLAAIVKAEGPTLSAFVVGRFNQIIAEPADTRGSVLANLTTALAPWDNPLIAGATSHSDFDIRELRRKRMSIYIGPPPSDLESYRGLIRLLVQQIHDAMMRELPGPQDRYNVLVMLDEFRQLHRMDAIVEKIPISAGYGFHMAIIIQNISQLDDIYGRATREGIVANCALKLFVSVDDLATANYVSDQLGNRTVTTTTTNFRRGNSPFGERSVSRSLTSVPLMRPDEVIRLPKRNSILMIANERPILTRKIRYDKDRLFRRLRRTGRFTFRSVPDVPLLDEPPLPILTKEYGKAPSAVPAPRSQAESAPRPMIGAVPMNVTSDLAVTTSDAAKDGLLRPTPPRPLAKQSSLRADLDAFDVEEEESSPAAPQPAESEDSPGEARPTVSTKSRGASRRKSKSAPANDQTGSKGNCHDGSGNRDSTPPEAPAPDADGSPPQDPSKDQAASASKKAVKAGARAKPRTLAKRPPGRDKDTLMSAFGVDAMPEIYQAARVDAEGLTRIAELVGRAKMTTVDQSHREEIDALVLELHRTARASRVGNDGELETSP